MTKTIEEKIQDAEAKRQKLILQEAEAMTRIADEENELRKAELQKLLKSTAPKAERLKKLRARLSDLLDESDRIVAGDLYPAWAAMDSAVSESKASLKAFCVSNGLPKPPTFGRKALQNLSEAAPWVPVPLMDATNPDTGEVITQPHPAFQSFGEAFMAVWQTETKV